MTAGIDDWKLHKIRLYRNLTEESEDHQNVILKLFIEESSKIKFVFHKNSQI